MLISTGPQSVRCLQAAEALQGHGLSAGVLHVPSIKPVNKEEIVSASEKVKLVITVEEQASMAGWGAWWRKFCRRPRRGGSFVLESKTAGGNQRRMIICWTFSRCPRHV